MLLTIGELVRGNTYALGRYYQVALKRWREILARPGGGREHELARILAAELAAFGRDCDGNTTIAQEIFAVTGIAQFHDARGGFRGQEAGLHLVRLALARSECSPEAKAVARRVADYYGLEPLAGK